MKEDLLLEFKKECRGVRFPPPHPINKKNDIWGDFTIVQKLFKAGADIETKNVHDKSPREMGETIYQDKFDELLNG